jgi:hypothetical protein
MALAYEGDNYRSKRSYITTGAFNSVIYQYTTQLNGTTLKNEGKLTAVTTSPAGTALTATNCPAGRILRELGMKLYPGVHPGLAVGDTFNGAVVGTTATNKYWVKVFDAQTGVRGYIDPNAALFSVYNSDKSLEIQDAQENAGGAPTRLGQPIFTAGNIVTTGGSVFQQRPVLASGTTTVLTLTAAQTVGGVVSQAPGAAQAVNLPSTTSLITQMGSTVGLTAEFVYINTSGANIATITAGDGNTTIVGAAAVAVSSSARFLVTIATATTVVLYRA